MKANEKMLFQQTNQELLALIRTPDYKRFGYKPLACDINNGLCEEWAAFIADRLPGSEIRWLGEHGEPPSGDDGHPAHCVLFYKG